jgi:hypothetical protein
MSPSDTNALTATPTNREVAPPVVVPRRRTITAL